MGAFNILTSKITCPVCKKDGVFEIQFKYGDVWQKEYKVGQSVAWGGNDIGLPNLKKVLVEGIGGPCPNCGTDFINFNLILESDVIVDVIGIGINRNESFLNGFKILKN